MGCDKQKHGKTFPAEKNAREAGRTCLLGSWLVGDAFTSLASQVGWRLVGRDLGLSGCSPALGGEGSSPPAPPAPPASVRAVGAGVQ